MKEKNKKSLDEAIQNLPQYEPKASLWDAIDSGVQQSKSDVRLHQTIAELPTYSPPDMVWDNIVQQLEVDKPQKASLIRRLTWMKYAAAACIGMLMLIGVNHLVSQEKQAFVSTDMRVTVGYSEETSTIQAFTWEEDIAEDKTAFDIIHQACQQKMPICKTTEFSELRFELKDLEIAKRELRKNINEYDTDPTHKIQLARIERERSDVLKKMVAMI